MLDKLNKLHSCIQPTSEPVIVGIDEAGRGPVIGPMVYAVYVAPVDEHSSYRDSKELSPMRREAFFKDMKNYAYCEIHPAYITSYRRCGAKNLNEISREAVILLLQDVVSKCSNIRTVYIDGLGNNRDYEQKLLKHFKLNYVIENAADATYQVVSGASIVAKVIRDKAVAGLNCGSGYPGDPITKRWLKLNLGKDGSYPDFIRYTWATIKKMMPTRRSRELGGKLSGFWCGPN